MHSHALVKQLQACQPQAKPPSPPQKVGKCVVEAEKDRQENLTYRSRQVILTSISDITAIRHLLDRGLQAATAADPLAALTAIGDVERDLERRELDAVRAAIQRHSWLEIGTALGVSKQAAHQRLAKAWASQLKDEIKAESKAQKVALRAGRPEEAAAASARREALIAELKNANRRKKVA
jgi:hypothetical protein